MTSPNAAAFLESRERTLRRLLMAGMSAWQPLRTGRDPESLKNGADEEVTRLFDEVRIPLRRYLVCLGLSAEDADDGVQEAFLRLHMHLASLGDQSNLRAWLFHVARNLARDRYKRGWLQRIFTWSDDMRVLSVEDSDDTPEDRLLKQEKLAWLHSAMQRLTPQQVECLQLRVSGLKYREIASVMGIGISAVGELVQRATIRLKEDFDGNG